LASDVFNPFWAIFGKSLRFPENRKIMKINTKVLIFSKLHILADFSQNMNLLDFNTKVLKSRIFQI